jgi:flagellar biosynthesis protein FliR
MRFRRKEEDPWKYLMFFPESNVEFVVKTVSVLLAVALTVVAIVALWKVPQQQQAERLGLVGVFTLLVAGVLSISGARKAEVMMGTVGYSIPR